MTSGGSSARCRRCSTTTVSSSPTGRLTTTSDAWHTSSDAGAFLRAAGEFLGSAPVDNTVLLTEAAYLDKHPSTEARFGWFRAADGTTGAFLQAPRHAPVLSRMPDAALESLVDTVVPPFDVDSRM